MSLEPLTDPSKVCTSSGVISPRHSVRRTHYSQLALCCHQEASFPAANVFLLEYLRDTHDGALTIRRVKPNEQDAAMRSRSEPANIRKVQVLGNQESRFLLSRLPNFAITFPTQVLFGNSVNIVAEIRQDCGEMHRKVFVELDSHRMCGVAGTGKSSSAEAAAKAIAA